MHPQLLSCRYSDVFWLVTQQASHKIPFLFLLSFSYFSFVRCLIPYESDNFGRFESSELFVKNICGVSVLQHYCLQPSGTEFLKSRGPLVLSVPLGMRDEEAKLRKEEAVRAVAEAAAIVKDEAKAEVEELRRRLKAARKTVADSLGIVSCVFWIWCVDC